MTYKALTIEATGTPKGRVMIIYTGGTFGMVRNADGVLLPFDFSLIMEHLPTLRSLQLRITVVSFEKPIDSSEMQPVHWRALGEIIAKHYDSQDGFVVLHGTDTMAYTASALSFMLRGLSKSVVFTGAQLPISEPRSDARENLITALEIASARGGKFSRVPEVSIYFNYQLIRGSRARKVESMHFDAFHSENYPPLARAGVKIDYNDQFIQPPLPGGLNVLSRFDNRISIVKLFPGLGKESLDAVIRTPGLQALILETFGSGNAPVEVWFTDALRDAIGHGLLVLNISQCPGGMVVQGKYETSKALNEMGVISGGDMTTEAACTKLMLLLGEHGREGARQMISKPMAGEITE